MISDEMNKILSYLAEQGEGVAKTVREITDGTGLTSLVARKNLAKSAKDSMPLVEIGKTEDMLDGYKLTSYGLATLGDTSAAPQPKKAAKKPAASTRKAASKKVTSGPVTVEKSGAGDIQHKIAAYLVKEGKKKPVFRIAQDISENQDDVEKALIEMDSNKVLESELMTDFNERVYKANEKTKEVASQKPQTPAKSEEAAPVDMTAIDNAVMSVLNKEKELAGKALMSSVASASAAPLEQVEQRVSKLVADGVINEKPKGRGKTYSTPKAVADVQPAKKAAKKSVTPSVKKPEKTASAPAAREVASGPSAGKELTSEISNLMDMLEKSMSDDLTSASPHANDALEKLREYMTKLEDEVIGWRKLASTFVTGAKGIVD